MNELFVMITIIVLKMLVILKLDVIILPLSVRIITPVLMITVIRPLENVNMNALTVMTMMLALKILVVVMLAANIQLLLAMTIMLVLTITVMNPLVAFLLIPAHYVKPETNVTLIIAILLLDALIT
jgi:hypothetical protein